MKRPQNITFKKIKIASAKSEKIGRAKRWQLAKTKIAFCFLFAYAEKNENCIDKNQKVACDKISN